MAGQEVSSVGICQSSINTTSMKGVMTWGDGSGGGLFGSCHGDSRGGLEFTTLEKMEKKKKRKTKNKKQIGRVHGNGIILIHNNNNNKNLKLIQWLCAKIWCYRTNRRRRRKINCVHQWGGVRVGVRRAAEREGGLRRWGFATRSLRPPGGHQWVGHHRSSASTWSFLLFGYILFYNSINSLRYIYIYIIILMPINSIN